MAGGRRPVAVAAPFAAAAVLALLGLSTAALVVLVLAVLLAGLRVVHPATAERLDRGMVWVGGRLAELVSLVLLGVVHLLIVVPVWAVTRVLCWSPLRRMAGGGRWQPGTAGSVPARGRPTHRRTFARESAPSSVRQRAHGATVSAALVALLAVVVVVAVEAAPGDLTVRGLGFLSGDDGARLPPGPVHDDVYVEWDGVPISQRSFPGEPHAEDLFAEFDRVGDVPDPDYGWRTADATGAHVNVEDGVRATRPPDGDPSATVWLLGGSTTYGFGQRDDHTIASELVEVAGRSGVELEVVNLGVSAYVNAQEPTPRRAAGSRRTSRAGRRPSPRRSTGAGSTTPGGPPPSTAPRSSTCGSPRS